MVVRDLGLYMQGVGMSLADVATALPCSEAIFINGCDLCTLFDANLVSVSWYIAILAGVVGSIVSRDIPAATMTFLRVSLAAMILAIMIFVSFYDWVATPPPEPNTGVTTQSATETAGPSEPPRKKMIRYSKNWSGAVNTKPPSGYFAAAGMKFTVPKTLRPDIVKGNTDYYAASAWVGIDGLTHGTALLQTGVTIEVNKTNSEEVTYVPWYEWWPNIAMRLDIPIGGGDEIEVEVVMFNATSGKILLWNRSKGDWVARALQAPRSDAKLAGRSVEWIVEDFALSEGGNVPFGDFGVIELRDCKAHTSTDKVVGPDPSQPFYIRQDNLTRTNTSVEGQSVSIQYLTTTKF